MKNKKMSAQIVQIVFVILLMFSIPLWGSVESMPVSKNQGLNFEKNKGQFHSDVKFLARGNGYQVVLGEKPVIELLENYNSETDSGIKRFSIDIKGAKKSAQVIGENKLPLKTNYLRGQSHQWITDAQNFSKVKYVNVIKGIDVVYYGNKGRLEYDFIVKPGVNPKHIQIIFKGSDKVSIAEDGGLWIHLGEKKLKQLKPVVYQFDAVGNQQLIAANYKIDSDTVAFELGEYDLTKELIIDPIIDYATYYGGDGDDVSRKVAVDATDNIYMMSATSSVGMSTIGAYEMGPETSRFNILYNSYCQGCTDGGPDPSITYQVERPYIDKTPSLLFTKFSSDGKTQLYATYITGLSGVSDTNSSMAVSDIGELAFGTNGAGAGLPLVNETQTEGSVYVAKLNASGNGLVFSTYLDSHQFRSLDVAVDGTVAVTGFLPKNSFSGFHNFIEVNPIVGQSCVQHQDFGDYTDMYVAQFDASGSLEFSSCLGGKIRGNGGSSYEWSRSIKIGNNGNLYLLGETNSVDFPVVNGFQSELSGLGFRDGTITVINPSASDIVYSSYFGPFTPTNIIDTQEVIENYHDDRSFHVVSQILVDDNNDVIVSGATAHAGLGTKNAFQPNLNYPSTYDDNHFAGYYYYGFKDTFVTKIDLTTGVEWSTYLGGSGSESGEQSMAVDSLNNIYVYSTTTSDDYPVLGAIQTNTQRGAAVLSKLTSSGGLAFSSYLDSKGETTLRAPGGVVVNSQNKVILGGYSSEEDFPVTGNGSARVGGMDATLLMLDFSTDVDSDGDGVPDAVDDFPNDINEWKDTDNDSTGDNADTDDDQDGVLDNNDFFPKDASETIDSDADGVGDNGDEYPNDDSEAYDSDGDGTGDVADLDSDNDGYPDGVDSFIMNANEGLDSDGDGVGNNADMDNDDDGLDDMVDPDPLNSQNPMITFETFNPTNTAVFKSPLPTGFAKLAGSDKAWTADYSDFYTGRVSMGSFDIDNNETAGLQYGGEFAEGNIGFWYKVDSELGNDIFTFAIDGNVVLTQSGETGWVQFTTAISAGEHTLTWLYSKNGSVSIGDDAVRIDDLTGFPTGPVDLSVNITDNSPSDGLPAGSQITYTVTVSNSSANGTTDASVNIGLPDSSLLSNVSWVCLGGSAAECQSMNGRGSDKSLSGNTLNVLIDFFRNGNAIIEITGDVTSNEVPVVVTAEVQLTTDSRDTNPSDNIQTVENQVGIFAHGFE